MGLYNSGKSHKELNIRATRPLYETFKRNVTFYTANARKQVKKNRKTINNVLCYNNIDFPFRYNMCCCGMCLGAVGSIVILCIGYRAYHRKAAPTNIVRFIFARTENIRKRARRIFYQSCIDIFSTFPFVYLVLFLVSFISNKKFYFLVSFGL